jgi:hypothetical protein
MRDHTHTPSPAFELCDLSISPDAAESLSRILHLSLEQHAALVVLRDLIEALGFHEALDDHDLICGALRCTAEHWHDNIAPAIVPVLEAEAGETA